MYTHKISKYLAVRPSAAARRLFTTHISFFLIFFKLALVVNALYNIAKGLIRKFDVNKALPDESRVFKASFVVELSELFSLFVEGAVALQ